MEHEFTACNIEKYDLFGTKAFKGIKRALQISKNKIIVYLEKHLYTDSVKIWRVSADPSKTQNPFVRETITGFSAEQRDQKIVIIGDFDPYFNYHISIDGQEMPVILDPKIGGILDTHFAPEKDEIFGAKIYPDFVQFKLWSPPAVCVQLLLYEPDAQTLIFDNHFLHKLGNGIHTIDIHPESVGKKSIEGCYYQYRVYAYERIQTASDPYAMSMAPYNPKEGLIGKSAIIKTPDGRPDNFKNSDIIQSSAEVIAYEMHVRDFTSEPDFCEKDKAGTFKGLGEHSNYFKDLGITHLQLLPVNKCHTQNDTDKRFSEDNTDIDNYNWGYDPLNYFSLEGRYAQNPFQPEARIDEFREMVSRLHQAGIGLIADVVFNHVYSACTFEHAAPGCYLRFTENFNISVHTGAGPSLESRRQAVRKLILDAGAYYVQVLGFDGFRFDLMEFTDKETLRQFREKIGRLYDPRNPFNLVLQGEAWDFKDIDYRESFTKLHRPKGLDISMFNDVMRDSALGHTTEGGFFLGRTNRVSRLASAISGGIQNFDQEDFLFAGTDFFHPYHLFADTPSECLNFLSVHDGLTLWDKINLTIKDPEGKLRLQIAKQSLTALFTAQGRLILHGGTEILRTKPVSPGEKDNPRALTSKKVDAEEGSNQFHDNSYRSADFTNMMRHSRLKNDYAPLATSMRDYVKGLIRMRRETEAFRYEKNEDILKALRFLTNENDSATQDCLHVHSFKSHRLKKLEIEFINGPQNDILFLAGEIHPDEANPIKRPIPVRFGHDGKALVKFSRKEIDHFDLNKWQAYHLLNIKLVRTPGEWDMPTEYYSGSGSNALSPCDIDENFRIRVDLSQKNASSEDRVREIKKDYLAYRILNLRPNTNSDFASADSFFVIHNAESDWLEFSHPELREYTHLKLLADSVQINPKSLATDDNETTDYTSPVKIREGRVHLPAHCSVVIAAWK